jgi:hypothetical protein
LQQECQQHDLLFVVDSNHHKGIAQDYFHEFRDNCLGLADGDCILETCHQIFFARLSQLTHTQMTYLLLLDEIAVLLVHLNHLAELFGCIKWMIILDQWQQLWSV